MKICTDALSLILRSQFKIISIYLLSTLYNVLKTAKVNENNSYYILRLFSDFSYF